MSFVGEVRYIPRGSLKELDGIQREAVENGDFDELFSFLNSLGEDLRYEYSGSVIFDLFNFLRVKKGIDLEKNEMSDFLAGFLGSLEEGFAIYSLFDQKDKDRFLKSLDPARFSIDELQSYYEKEYRSSTNQNAEYGSYMKETLKFLFDRLRDLDEDHLLFIGIFY